MNLSKELLAKAKTAKTIEELMVLAKENDIEMTENEARITLRGFKKSGELSDEELDNVSGGGCNTEEAPYRCADWGPADGVEDDAYNGCDNCDAHKRFWGFAGSVWDCARDEPNMHQCVDWSKYD